MSLAAAVTTWVEVATMSTMLTQACFIAAGYGHAIWHREMSFNGAHISAVLDNDSRSRLCSGIGLLALLSLVVQEIARDLPLLSYRLCLALCTGVGIILTCTVRESTYINGHRACAVLAFGSAVSLVLLVAYLSETSMHGAHALVAGAVFTGLAQVSNIIGSQWGVRLLPSFALGCCEILLVLGFGLCMGLYASAHNPAGNATAARAGFLGAGAPQSTHCTAPPDLTAALSYSDQMMASLESLVSTLHNASVALDGGRAPSMWAAAETALISDAGYESWHTR